MIFKFYTTPNHFDKKYIYLERVFNVGNVLGNILLIVIFYYNSYIHSFNVTVKKLFCIVKSETKDRIY